MRRVEPGTAGAVVLEARSTGEAIQVEVWGSAATPPDEIARHLSAAAAWAGCDDDLGPFRELVQGHPVVAELHRQLGDLPLSRVPRVGEAFGRAVLGQLVQAVEARRSAVQVAACAGTPGPGGLWAWPTAAELGATQAWSLRRCGVSLRGVRALHAGAVEDGRLSRCGTDWARLDARLRALPGVGVWTSGETRLALGDPDAVAVGDYHLPSVVGTVLTGEQRARTQWTDAEMLALLEPFRGQRGRVIQLLLRGAHRVGRRPQRRAPRAALSAHRYW